eukprot:TRINITY_DN27249_c0_g1_i1.p1 TRINITY_DN27249_c0_g1~~TRINITY_DN27249_c0_g1_i1.p1  ORF type:complete len:510 (-),score=109.55 TRINITY_DN27249_c0_g1_i1:147-1676(-)
MAYVHGNVPLEMEVSAQHGEGEGSMTDFIHQHFASILKPFADHVERLGSEITSISNDLAVVGKRIAPLEGRLDESSDLINMLRRELDATRKQSDMTERTLSAKLEQLERDRKVAIEEALQKREAQLRTLEDENRYTHSALLEFQEECTAKLNMIPRLEASVVEVNTKIGTFDFSAVHRLMQETASLEAAHHSAMEDFHKAEKRAQQEHEDLLNFLEVGKVQRHEHEVRFKELQSAIDTVITGLKMSNEHSKSQDLRSKNMIDDIATLERRCIQASKAQTVQENTCKELSRQFKSLKEELDEKLKEIKDKLSHFDVVDEKLLELAGMATNSISNIEKLDLTSKNLGQEIVQTNLQMSEIEPRIQKAFGEAEDRNTSRFKKIEELLWANEQADQDERDKTATEAAARIQDKIEFLAKFDAQKTVNERMDELLQKLGVDLGATGDRVQSLETQLPPMQEELASLRTGIDLTQEYWKGLTKGFQKTHQTVAVDQDLLSPKVSKSRLLPSLTPR